MDTNIRYKTTDTYGKMIRTVPNLKSDEEIIGKFIDYLKPSGECSLANIRAEMDKFVCLVEDALIKCLPADGKFSTFSSGMDHAGYAMARYILQSQTAHYNYIIDVYPTLDVKLVLSSVKRFILKNIPRKWSSINFSEIVPDISFNVKIWNTPVSHYVINCHTISLKDVEYSYKVEQMRSIVGLPQSCNPKERNVYERSDYYVRRALFGEVSDSVATRHGIQNRRV